MDFHAEVMPQPQQRVLNELGGITAEQNFYLAGGTATQKKQGKQGNDERLLCFPYF